MTHIFSAESGGHTVPTVAPVEAGGIFDWLWLLIALPAAGAAVILLLGNRRTSAWAHLVGTATVLGSFLLAAVAFATLLGRSEDERQVGSHVYTWFEAGDLTADFGILFDPLSSLFVLLITGVGGLIHVYSIGYMAHDERRVRKMVMMMARPITTSAAATTMTKNAMT